MVSWRSVADLISHHKETRPLMRSADAYKLLYQGVFGVGHIMNSDVWNQLNREAERLNLGDQPNEPLGETVSINTQIIRVNLRPYLRGGYQLNQLMEAMRASEIKGQPPDFLEVWDAFAELVWAGKLPFDREEVTDINNHLDRDSPKPIHHTKEYREAYQPAYRVIRRRELLTIVGLQLKL